MMFFISSSHLYYVINSPNITMRLSSQLMYFLCHQSELPHAVFKHSVWFNNPLVTRNTYAKMSTDHFPLFFNFLHCVEVNTFLW